MYMDDTLITTREAARQLCLERRQVNNLLKRGKLRGELLTARFWAVYQDSVDALAGERISARVAQDREAGPGNEPSK